MSDFTLTRAHTLSLPPGVNQQPIPEWAARNFFRRRDRDAPDNAQLAIPGLLSPEARVEENVLCPVCTNRSAVVWSVATELETLQLDCIRCGVYGRWGSGWCTAEPGVVHLDGVCECSSPNSGPVLLSPGDRA